MVRALRTLIALSLVLGSAAIVASVIEGRAGEFRFRLLVSALIGALGGSLAWIAATADVSRPWPRRLSWICFGATAAGSAVSLLLAWTGLVTDSMLWRAWWFLGGVSLTTAHVLLLLRVRPEPWLLQVRNATIGSVLVFATIVIGMTARKDVFEMPGGLLSLAIYVAGGLEALGSLILLAVGRPDPSPLRVPWTAVRYARWIAFPILLFAGGFYAGRVSAPPEDVFETGGGVLAGLSPEMIDAHVASDVVRLKATVEAVQQIKERAIVVWDEVLEKRRAEGRAVFTPDEDDAIRSLFLNFLACRTSLLRMVAFYQGFSHVKDEGRRNRCFLTGYAAGATCYATSLSLIHEFKDDAVLRSKLNEPEPAWGIPPGMFDRIHQSVALDRHVELFREMTAYFNVNRGTWRESGLPPEDLAWISGTIEHAVAAVKTNPQFGRGVPVDVLLAKVKQDAYSPVYAVQSIVSEWMGDTRLVSRPPCISQDQVEALRAKLRPGDIILERRNWYLSNAFLPGFWPHAALYVGTLEDLRALGIADDPVIRDRVSKFQARAHDGEARCVIESISEGVSFSTLGEATRADYIAVLRPRVGDDDRRRAILRAFSHQGKPYDFEFDFFSSDKLVCTELVYRAYEGVLHFDLVKIMGRMTLPAVEMARKYVRERGPKAELDFVLFLDTPPGGTKAVDRDEAAFVESAERPRAFNE